MSISNVLLRYFYIWVTSAVFITEALTGLRGSMQIAFFSDEPEVSIPVWGFCVGFACFLILTGLIHIRLDKKGPALPRWIKRAHPVVSVLFGMALFIYIQVLENRRLSNPKRYFQADQLRYWEEVNIAVVLLAVAFLAAQVLFVWFLVKAIRKRQTIVNKP